MLRQKRPIRLCTDEDRAEHEDLEAKGGEYDIYGLNDFESDWVTYYDYLLSKGYQLRPRYRPGWVRSWKGTNLDPDDCEDSWTQVSKSTLDALRLSDNQQVMIKKLLPGAQKQINGVQTELAISQHLSSSALREDVRNHAMEYIDSFPIPGIRGGVFLVTNLYTTWNRPPFENLDQAFDCIRQVLEGLTFLHENRVAHRDCILPNIMMDPRPLINEPFHPIRNECSLDGEYFIERRRRSEAAVKYYYIDFDLASWFPSSEERPEALGTQGRVRAPELSDVTPYNPFQLDVFIIGTFLEQEFLNKYHDFGFLRSTIHKMKREDPGRRPTAAQVEASFLRAITRISPRTRTWPLTRRPAGFKMVLLLGLGRTFNQFIFVFQKFFHALQRPGLFKVNVVW